MKINLMTKELAAVLPACSRDETRYILNSVLVHCKKGNRPVLVATNGSILVAVQTESSNEDSITEEVILPSGFVRELCLLTKRIRCAEIELETYVQEQVRCVRATFRALGFENSELATRCIDGTYPKWTECVPNIGGELKGRSTSINPALLAQVAACAKILDPQNFRSLKLFFNDELSCISIASPARNFHAVLMPMRSELEMPKFVNQLR